MAKGHKRHSFKKGKHFGKRGKGQTKTKTKEWEEKFNQFQEFLKSKGLYMRDVEGDGNCLFRAISDQMIGDESMHEQYRLMAVDYIKSRKEYFAMFLQEGENIDDHITAMSKDGVWGGDFELVALSEVLGVKFCIHTKDQTPFIVKSSEKKKFSRVVHLAYHVGEHYSSVRMLGDDKKEPAMEIQMKLPDDSDEDEIVTEESILKIRSFFLSSNNQFTT